MIEDVARSFGLGCVREKPCGYVHTFGGTVAEQLDRLILDEPFDDDPCANMRGIFREPGPTKPEWYAP